MIRPSPLLWLLLVWGSLAERSAADDPAGTLEAGALEFFESKIRPVLAESCYECHNSVDKKKGDLALDWKTPLLESGVIVPGKPEESDLIAAISHAKGYEPMPDKGPKLTKVTIKQFEEWIRMGAPDPRTTKPTKADLASQVDWPTVRDKRAEWWAFQPLRKTDPPRTGDPDWEATAIDRFVAARLRTEGLTPQPEADPATLVRRLHLVLTGLPPTPEVVREFAADPTPTRYAALVDRLLASPRFGERWARHWMDWYRYAESHGSEGDPAVPYAKVYRDYLIRALNADVPYDQLIREHLAGDLLPDPRLNQELGLNESAIGPAHLRMVPHGFGVTNAYDEQVTFTDNQVDVVSKAMLGLTVSCARCHNHKFDPISQEDFYRFYGIMVSSRPAVRNVDSPARREMNRAQIEALKDSFRRGLADHWLEGLDAAVQRLEKAKLAKLPETDPLAAWAAGSDHPPRKLESLLQAHTRAHRERLAHNEEARRKATFHLDLRDPSSAGQWFGIGNGLSGAVSPAGSFAVAPEGDQALTGIYPAGIYSHLVSDKHNATLNTVFHRARGSHNAIRGVGRGAMARFAMRSYALSHGLLHPSTGFDDRIGWKTIGKYEYWNGEMGYHQVATSADKTFRGGGERSWFGILEIIAGETMPRETGAPLAAWHPEPEAIRSRDELLQAYRLGLHRALQDWRDGTLDDPHAQLLDAALRHGILNHDLAALPESLRRLVTRYRTLEAAIPVPTRVAGVMEAEVWDQPLLERGDPRQEGEPVTRRFLEVFPGEAYPADASGRLELAEDILDNPLSSRIIVNRLWHHVFGSGLVPSPDNFGRLGQPPSHPALLDHLALAMRASGWSLKTGIRDMVLSRTFRSASLDSPQSAEKDPANRLLAHYPPRRLEAEAIHDSLQFIASGKSGRRAVHLPVVRNRLDPFLTTFNFPVPTTTTGARDLTNVPGQSLTLLNGPLANRSAEQWARRIQADRRLTNDETKVARMFEEAYARPPEPAELQACLDFLAADPGNSKAPLLARRDQLRDDLARLEQEREALLAPVKTRLSGNDRPAPPDLNPVVEWDFAAGLEDRRAGLGGRLLGGARVEDGSLVLDGGCFLSEPLPRGFHEKTLEVVLEVAGLDQRGGGALTIQTLDGEVFDSIVLGERQAGKWMAGSDHFHRTSDFGGPPETLAGESPVHLALVLRKDGTSRLFRNGEPYGEPYRKAPHVRYEAGQCQIAIGLRHGRAPAPGRILRGRVFAARLHDRALTPEEIAASSATSIDTPTSTAIRAAMTGAQRSQLDNLDSRREAVRKELQDVEQDVDDQDSHDPWTRLAHALINTKEFIYVR